MADISFAALNTKPPASSRPSYQQFFVLGVEHILIGFDHLLFLCGLLVVCRRIKSMIAVITSFTLAHSLTLALVATGIVVLPTRLIECLIAASIIYVGLENLIRRDDPPGRVVITFFFGLLHGFGFANVLRNIGLSSEAATMMWSLLSFNLGVEVGQLAVAVVALPILWRIRSHPKFSKYVVPIVSVFVSVLGIYWLLERI